MTERERFRLYLVAIGSGDSEVLAFNSHDFAPLSVLCSALYWHLWRRVRDRLNVPVARYTIDSGAFTAHKSGEPLETGWVLRRYAEIALDLRGVPARFVANDAIGNPDASLRNFNEMRECGVDVMPVWHIGEPLDLLKEYARLAPIVGIGGVASKKVAKSTNPETLLYKTLDGVFNAIYPHRMHLFGIRLREIHFRYPFFSADTSSWTAPFRWGFHYDKKGRQIRPGGPVGGPGKRAAVADAAGMRDHLRHIHRIERQIALRWRNEPIW